MKTFSIEQLAEVVAKHKLYLQMRDGGERADLQGANLQGANLQRAYLEGANLRGAYLEGANLQRADLQGANLRGANLRGAYLQGADLRDADLRDANLRGANLRDADLQRADLRGAYLRGANLQRADLQGANLRDANLRGAYLRDADLQRADLEGAKNLEAVISWNGANGNLREVKAVQCDIWPVTYTAEHLQIGCQLHLITEWWAFGAEEIQRMDSQASAWWSVWKPILQTIIAASPAVPTITEATSNEKGQESAT